MQRFGSSKAKRVLVLVPGFLGGAGDFRLDRPRHREARAGPPGVGLRPPLAGVRGHVGVPRRRPRQGRRLLPGLQVQARAGHGRPLRRRVGAEAVARGPAPRGAQGARRRAAQGDPRRALARRVDHRGLRRVGLQRQAGLQGPRGHGADRRRAARDLQQRLARAGARRCSRRSARARCSPTCSGSAFPRSPGIFAEVAALYARKQPNAPSAAAGQPAHPRDVQASGASHQRGRARLRVRQATPRPRGSSSSASTRARSPRPATRAGGSTAS